ncbi:MAG: hypothetical protein AAGF77_14245, partial [Bacteroidota bacterium]
GRYLFIIGQLYDQTGFKDSANYAYDKVIDLNRRSPRVYMINAHLNKIVNTSITPENEEELLEYLTDLEENRENRPFLDKIYHHIANYHLTLNADSMAIVYYNKSLRATQQDRKLNARNYETLGEYYFNEKAYRQAGSYYDSTLTFLAENTKKYRSVKKKFDNLEDVIAYEDIVQHADSVITVYRMPEEERAAYFEAYIETLKAIAAEREAEKEKKANAGYAAYEKTSGGKENKGKFYFYNIKSLGYGKNDFKTRWGERLLEDDWRWSNKARIAPVENPQEALADAAAIKAKEEEKYNLDFYLEQIPTDEGVIDSLITERNFANYQLGLIYKEKFKENMLAAAKLEAVLQGNPEERLILPSKYNLFKIYEETESPLAIAMKQDIINNHPTSRYAEILLNPDAVLASDGKGPEARYKQLFKLYRKQAYAQVINKSQEYIRLFTGDPIVPKFELLKANAIGRLQGFEPYKEALNYVALTYPNNPEGKKAQKILVSQLPKLANPQFSKKVESTGTGNWKVVFPFTRLQDDLAAALQTRLVEAIEELKYRNIVSTDIYNSENQFVVVHGFRSRDFALGFAELIKNNKDYRIKDENFVISSLNYQTILIHKNLDAYMAQLLIPKP